MDETTVQEVFGANILALVEDYYEGTAAAAEEEEEEEAVNGSEEAARVAEVERKRREEEDAEDKEKEKDELEDDEEGAEGREELSDVLGIHKLEEGAGNQEYPAEPEGDDNDEDCEDDKLEHPPEDDDEQAVDDVAVDVPPDPRDKSCTSVQHNAWEGRLELHLGATCWRLVDTGCGEITALPYPTTARVNMKFDIHGHCYLVAREPPKIDNKEPPTLKDKKQQGTFISKDFINKFMKCDLYKFADGSGVVREFIEETVMAPGSKARRKGGHEEPIAARAVKRLWMEDARKQYSHNYMYLSDSGSTAKLPVKAIRFRFAPLRRGRYVFWSLSAMAFHLDRCIENSPSYFIDVDGPLKGRKKSGPAYVQCVKNWLRINIAHNRHNRTWRPYLARLGINCEEHVLRPAKPKPLQRSKGMPPTLKEDPGTGEAVEEVPIEEGPDTGKGVPIEAYLAARGPVRDRGQPGLRRLPEEEKDGDDDEEEERTLQGDTQAGFRFEGYYASSDALLALCVHWACELGGVGETPEKASARGLLNCFLDSRLPGSPFVLNCHTDISESFAGGMFKIKISTSPSGKEVDLVDFSKNVLDVLVKDQTIKHKHKLRILQIGKSSSASLSAWLIDLKDRTTATWLFSELVRELAYSVEQHFEDDFVNGRTDQLSAALNSVFVHGRRSDPGAIPLITRKAQRLSTEPRASGVHDREGCRDHSRGNPPKNGPFCRRRRMGREWGAVMGG